MTLSRLSRKLLVAAASTTVFGFAAYCAYPYLETEVETVRVVDTTDRLQAASLQRSQDQAPVEVVDSNADHPPELLRERLDETSAALFYPGLETGQSSTYDPQEFIRRRAHYDSWFKFGEHPDGGFRMRTNGLGFREDSEVLDPHPDWRVLITGDSHTEGVCANSESFPNVLEHLLGESNPQRTVEVLNAGTGAHNLFNYLGTFERFAFLKPDLYVVTVYGGNDFAGSMMVDRFIRHQPPFKQRPNRFFYGRIPRDLSSFIPQELSQDAYFANNPADFERAVDITCAFSVELERLCAENSTRLLFVYLPPPSVAQPQFFEAELKIVMQNSEFDQTQLGVSDRIADRWLQFLDDRGLAYIDLRPSFKSAESCLYWRSDHHLNLAGQQAVAKILFDQLDGQLAR